MTPPLHASMAAPDAAAQGGVEKRTQPDRRGKPTGLWGAFPPAGQRLRNRRTDEHRQPYFTDRFSSAMFILVVLLLAASIVDAVLTIHLLRAGADEINPLMDGLLDRWRPAVPAGQVPADRRRIAAAADLPKPLPVRYASPRGISDSHRCRDVRHPDWLPTRPDTRTATASVSAATGVASHNRSRRATRRAVRVDGHHHPQGAGVEQGVDILDLGFDVGQLAAMSVACSPVAASSAVGGAASVLW